MMKNNNGTSAPRKPRRFKDKICRLCENKVNQVDFKDVELLKKYQTENGKILPRRITGNCPRHQKMLGICVKRARNVALVL